MRNLIIIIFISTIYLSCNINGNKLNDFNSFADQEELRAKHFPTDSMLGLPMQVLIKDTLLLVNEFRYDFLLYFYDIRTGKLIKKNANAGNGPDEFSPPLNISFNPNGQLLIDEGRKFRFHKYSIKNDLSIGLISSVKFKNFNNQKVFLINEDKLLATGLFKDCRFVMYDNMGNKIKCFGDFPKIKIYSKTGKETELNDDTKAMLYQAKVVFSTNSDKFVVANSQMGLLEAYSKKNGEYVKTEEFALIDYIKLKAYSSGKSISAKISDSYAKGFVDIHIYNDNVYALYSGSSKNNPKKESYLMVFTLDLNPVKLYILNKVIDSFDIDFINKKIFGINEDNGEPEIVYFNF